MKGVGTWVRECGDKGRSHVDEFGRLGIWQVYGFWLEDKEVGLMFWD